MAFGARQAFLDAAASADDDEPVGLAAGLQLVLDLLKDPKRADALARKALDAAKATELAQKARNDLDALRRKTDA